MRLDDEHEGIGEEYGEADPKEGIRPTAGIFVFLGLMLLTGLICGVLWKMTHNGDRGAETFSDESTVSISEAPLKLSPESGGTPQSPPGSGEASGEESSGASEEEAEAPDLNEADSGGREPEEDAGAMVFQECHDKVTPKEVINLRSTPDTTAQTDNIVSQAVNGELLTRTGINSDTGWSRVEYNGQTLYAVSAYLTSDLSYQPPAVEGDFGRVSTKDGRIIVFTDCDDNISPKIYVNLRLEPSTSEGNDTVYCGLEYGQVVHRTGVSGDSGWSRVEYDGHVLYVVTSYIFVVESEE